VTLRTSLNVPPLAGDTPLLAVTAFTVPIVYIGCSECRLIEHSFYRRNFLRKSCATCREKYRRAAPRTEKSDKPVQWTPCISQCDLRLASVMHFQAGCEFDRPRLIPGRVIYIPPHHHCSYRPWAAPSLLCSGYWEQFPAGKIFGASSLLPSAEEMEVYLHGHILFMAWYLIKLTDSFVYVVCFTRT
jgi:hypothetical protein